MKTIKWIGWIIYHDPEPGSWHDAVHEFLCNVFILALFAQLLGFFGDMGIIYVVAKMIEF